MRLLLRICLLCLIVVSSNTSIAQDSLESLKQFQWSNRIVLVRLNSEREQNSELLANFDLYEFEIEDRDIYWFVLDDELSHSNYPGEISDQFATYLLATYFQNTTVNSVLIGKDGGVKDRSAELNLPELFVLIDGMPMRRAEMQRQ